MELEEREWARRLDMLTQAMRVSQAAEPKAYIGFLDLLRREST